MLWFSFLKDCPEYRKENRLKQDKIIIRKTDNYFGSVDYRWLIADVVLLYFPVASSDGLSFCFWY